MCPVVTTCLASSRPDPRWIPATDRPPEPRQRFHLAPPRPLGPRPPPPIRLGAGAWPAAGSQWPRRAGPRGPPAPLGKQPGERASEKSRQNPFVRRGGGSGAALALACVCVCLRVPSSLSAPGPQPASQPALPSQPARPVLPAPPPHGLLLLRQT